MAASASGSAYSSPSLISSISSPQVTAGSTAFVTVSLSSASPNTVTFMYQTANATAYAGSNYSATSGTISFAPYQTTATISIQTLNGNNTGAVYFNVFVGQLDISSPSYSTSIVEIESTTSTTSTTGYASGTVVGSIGCGNNGSCTGCPTGVVNAYTGQCFGQGPGLPCSVCASGSAYSSFQNGFSCSQNDTIGNVICN